MRVKNKSIFALLLAMLCALFMGIVSLGAQPANAAMPPISIAVSDYMTPSDSATTVTCTDETTMTYKVTSTADGGNFKITAGVIQHFISLGNETMNIYFKNMATSLTAETWKQVQFHSTKDCYLGTDNAATGDVFAGVTKTVTLADYKDTGIYFYTDKCLGCDLSVTLTLANTGNSNISVAKFFAPSDSVTAVTCTDETTMTYKVTSTADGGNFKITAGVIQHFISLGNETMNIYFKNMATSLTAETWKQVQFHSTKDCYLGTDNAATGDVFAGVTKTVTLADYKDTGIYFYTDKCLGCDLSVTLTLANKPKKPISISEFFTATKATTTVVCNDEATLTYTISATEACSYAKMSAEVVQYLISLDNVTMDFYFKNNAVPAGNTWKQVKYNSVSNMGATGTVSFRGEEVLGGVTSTVTLADYKDTGIYLEADKCPDSELIVTLTLHEGVAVPEFDETDITMLVGGSVRMSNPTGLGFTTRIDKAAYDELVAKVGADNVTTGTLILPTDYLTGDFTIAALTAGSYKNVVNSGWQNADTAATDGYYQYRGSLAPVQEHNYERKFSARGYLAYTYNGETHYVYTSYSETDNARSVAAVAKAAYEDVYKAGPAKSGWFAVENDCTVNYVEGKGWKVTATGEETQAYMFKLTQATMAHYIAQGATALKITFGGSFDGTNHAGAPVNCRKWIIPTPVDSSVNGWAYNAGYISGLTSNGDNNTYYATIDLTDTTYNFANYDLQIYVECNDVENNAVGACYIYDAKFIGVEEKDAAKYPYAVVADEYTFDVDGLYSPYTTAQRQILSGYIAVDDTVTSEDTEGTAYQIVMSSAATATETTAANSLAEYLSTATGTTFSVIPDSAVSGFSGFSKYISVGNTSLLRSANLATYAENNVSGDGYIWKTVGCTLFIDGLADRGTLYGVMDFAEKYLGYVFIDGECTTAGSISSLSIGAIDDRKFTPYVETRSYLEYDVCQGYTDPSTAVARKTNNYYLRSMDGYGGYNDFGYYGDNPAHTMLATLKKGIELDGGSKNYTDYTVSYPANDPTNYQPCLTNTTVKSLMANAMKSLIQEKYASGIRYYALTQEDSTATTGYCDCTNCSNARTTYGGQSGVTLKFMNDIVEILNADTAFLAACPDYKLYTFAYAYSVNCPTVATSVIKANERVAVMVCPTATDATYDLFDTTHNSISATLLNGWVNYCDDLMVWMYDANFSSYVEYHPTLTGVIANNVYKLKKLGVSYIMVNGAYNSDGLWDDKLRAYVYSELLYDFDETAYAAGADAYVQSIVTKYLNAYYGKYADTVQGVITYFQNAYSGKKIEENESPATASMFTDLKDQYETIKNAISKNTDETLEKRLYAVEAGILATMYESSSILFTSYKSEFKTACSKAGITQWAETQTIEAKFGS